MKVLRLLLLLLGLVANTADLRLDLQDLIVPLLDELLDSLEGLVTLLHAKETLLPVLQQRLLAHHDTLDFNGCLLEGVTGGSSLLLLRDKLSLVQSLLFIESLDLLIHCINEQILLLLGLLEVTNVLFSAISGTTSDCNLALHHLVILLYLLEGTIQLVELFLGLQYSL